MLLSAIFPIAQSRRLSIYIRSYCAYCGSGEKFWRSLYFPLLPCLSSCPKHNTIIPFTMNGATITRYSPGQGVAARLALCHVITGNYRGQDTRRRRTSLRTWSSVNTKRVQRTLIHTEGEVTVSWRWAFINWHSPRGMIILSVKPTSSLLRTTVAVAAVHG